MLNLLSTPLPGSVTAINADISTSHERRGVGDEEDSSTTELRRVRDAAKHVLASPLGLALGVDVEEVLKHLGLDVTGRDGVDTDTVLAPFSSKRATKLQDGGLGGIVNTRYELAMNKNMRLRWKGTYEADMPRLAMVPDMEAIMQMLPGVLRRTI